MIQLNTRYKPEITGQLFLIEKKFVISEQFPMRCCNYLVFVM